MTVDGPHGEVGLPAAIHAVPAMGLAIKAEQEK